MPENGLSGISWHYFRFSRRNNLQLSSSKIVLFPVDLPGEIYIGYHLAGLYQNIQDGQNYSSHLSRRINTLWSYQGCLTDHTFALTTKSSKCHRHLFLTSFSIAFSSSNKIHPYTSFIHYLKITYKLICFTKQKYLHVARIIFLCPKYTNLKNNMAI